MSLPIKKIYVDSLFKLPESLTSSSFKIELPFAITMPDNAAFTVDEICIPHAWYNIESNINDKLYMHTLNDLNNTYNRNSKVITIPSGNYTGDLLKTILQSLITTAFVSVGQFEVLYDTTTFSISIKVAMGNTVISFWLLSDKEIATLYNGLWSLSGAGAFDRSNPASMNDVLRNYGDYAGVTPENTAASPYKSGFLNFQGINNIYLSSPNLGSFMTLGPRGDQTIIKKIPVSSEFGYMIIDRSYSQHDYLECGKTTIRTLEFNLKDSKGRFVPLHNANISFSLVFSIKSED
jgi:hypothetical protein